MVLLIGFAFLAGIVTVLSPCILPVLPVVLSGGVAGGKARPWGVITGFVTSFSVFTLTLSTLVQALGLDPDVLRWIAAGLIAVFGVILVVPALKDGFLTLATRLTQRSSVSRPGRPPGGFWSGLTLGLGLGVVWTPCVGPIMASVITLALTQHIDAGSVLLTIAYSLGTAGPLLLIMMGGRQLLNRMPWLTRHSSGIQRGFGVLMIVTAVALFTGGDRAFSTWLLQTFPQYGSGLTALENQSSVRAELDKRQVTPVSASTSTEIDPLTLGQGQWFNSPPLTMAGLKGKVVLVDIWTYSCINCVRTLPYLRAWYERYHAAGLEIVGVHSPEFAFERSADNVRTAIHDLNVTWPVVQDNAFRIWNAYHNQYWPAHFLYDRQGKLIQTHFGEGAYDETETAIAQALGVKPVQAAVVTDAQLAADRTPETYLGSGRGRRFASPEAVVQDHVSHYSVPASLEADHWALDGQWTIGPESSEGAAGSALVLHYRGKNVYLVLNPAGTRPVGVTVYRDGKKLQSFRAASDQLYTLLEGNNPSEGTLRVVFDGPTRVYALTFG